MPIQFLGMVRTNNISEIHGAGPTTGENVIDPPFLRDFFRAHDQNNFDRVLIGQHSHAPDGWPIASFGAAIGLGFLSQYEGLFISRLLPLFAALAFLANALGWFSHRQWLRSLLGMIGPAIVFAATVWLLGNWWTANLMYVGLALMIGVSIWDFVSPAHRRCGPDGCELPAKRL